MNDRMLVRLSNLSSPPARSWFLLFVALSALDATNAYDLLGGVCVLHDEVEMQAYLVGVGGGAAGVGPIHVVAAEAKARSEKMPGQSSPRVIFDQDSSSLLGEGALEPGLSPTVETRGRLAVHQQRPFLDVLHLRLRTLLL